MIVKTKLLLLFMKKHGMTNADLARAMGVSVIEIEKMLDGKAVGVNTARKFIRYFSAEQAQALIDWDTIGKKNPLADDYPDVVSADDNDEDDDEFDDETACELLDEDERYNESFEDDDL